jgi:hypothetical protein
MIKKSIIENNNLYFPEHAACEDFVCTLWYMASKKIVQINEALFYYFIRKNSILQEGKRETYISSIRTHKHILSSDYFNKLDCSVKKMLFLYYAYTISGFCHTVCINYATDFVKYCNSILDLFKIYMVNYNDAIYMQSEEDVCSREIFRFIEQNIDMPDFNLEFIAYYEYQYRRIQLRKINKLLPLYINKRLTLWGAGALGKRNAKDMSILGIEFEITDINTKIHGEKIVANVIVKPWDELKDRTDVVLVSAKGIFDEVKARLSKECPDIEVVDLINMLEEFK